MSKREKRLRKLRQNPKDVSFDELKQVLEDFDFEHVRTAGSHHTFVAIIEEQEWRLTIPFSRPIKTVYVRTALQAIDEIMVVLEQTETVDSDSEAANGTSED